mgnify:CR=1 FL=1
MILLLEDNKFFCEIFSEYLKNKQFDIIYKHKVEEAIEFVKQQRNKIKLCIVDILLNGRNGFSFVEFLHNFNNENNYDIKYIFLTGCHKDLKYYERIIEIMNSNEGKKYCYSYIVKDDFLYIKDDILNILNKFK